MPESSDIRIPTLAEPPVDPQVSDIYFDAVSISAEPAVAGSDQFFEVASNPTNDGGGGDPVRHPFQIISVGDDVILNGGLVNGIVLTDTSLNNRSGTDNFVVLEITVNSNGVSSISASVDSSAPDGIDFVKNGVNTSFKYPIAIVDEDRLVSQLVFSNLFFIPRIAYEEPKAQVSVGEYPNDIYYSWQAVNA